MKKKISHVNFTYTLFYKQLDQPRNLASNWNLMFEPKIGSFALHLNLVWSNNLETLCLYFKNTLKKNFEPHFKAFC